MFNDIMWTAGQYVENFKNGVHDNFGASIISDVLSPILNEISMLRSFNEEFQKKIMEIDKLLQEARALQLNGSNS